MIEASASKDCGTWRFDGLRAMDEFPLERIAPAQFAVPPGASISLNGEIPVSGP